MRSDVGRIACHRRALPLHAHDNASHAYRISEGRIEVHTDFRGRQIAHAPRCDGVAAQTRLCATSLGGVALRASTIVIPSEVEESLAIVWPLRSSEISRDVSTSVDMTKGNKLPAHNA